MGEYILRCPACGREIEDAYTNACSNHDSLLKTEYKAKKIAPKNLPGMWRFIDWLPVKKPLNMIDTNPITYKSEAFAKELRLSNLYISFSGYWPERKAYIKTCSFKELEAPPTFQRVIEKAEGILAIASAGNTARGFAQVSSIIGMQVITVVPKRCTLRMWMTEEPRNVCLISVDGDYSDAIKLYEKIATLDGIISEGGAKNVARRDGLGVILLDSLFFMKRLPDHYFQAVGSGTGGIATWEASKRVIEDGRFGDKLPKLHLSQNLPFAPMFHAWTAKRRQIIPEYDMPDAKKLIEKMYADVLSNRKPSYSVRGGVYDALVETGGYMYGVTNKEAEEAKKMFERAEGIDPAPAAAVCAASLIQAVKKEVIHKDDVVLLNVTGGGLERLMEDHSLIKMKPCFTAGTETPVDEIERWLSEWIRCSTKR